ncbi:hypothetical protein [Rickettsia endosymbiont of Aspidapion aeneum]
MATATTRLRHDGFLLFFEPCNNAYGSLAQTIPVSTPAITSSQ